jgi:hypothetical protein
MKNRLPFTYAALLLCVAAFAVPAIAQPKVYFSDQNGGQVLRTDLDGSNQEPLVFDLTAPRGVAVETTTNKLYWCDQSLGTIGRSDLDGSNAETIHIDSNSPSLIHIVPGIQTIYFLEGFPSQILSANLDGSNAKTIFQQAANSSGFNDFAVDPASDLIYWSEKDSAQIRRAKLSDASGQITLVDESLNFSAVPMKGLAIDTAHNKIYYTMGNALRSAALNDGSNKQNVMPLGMPGEAVALDLINSRVYVSSPDGDFGVISSGLDGSNIQEFASGSSVYGLAVDPRLRTLTPGTVINNAPIIVVNDHDATITMEKFAHASLSAAAAHAIAGLIAEAAQKKVKLGITYRLVVERTSDSDGNSVVGDVRRRDSKRNQITLKNLEPGQYTAKYRVFITKQDRRGTHTAAKTKFSPTGGFTINE